MSAVPEAPANNSRPVDNGAMTTDRCSHLIEAMEFIKAKSTTEDPVRAVVLMGGAYFSNGIA